MKQTAEIGGRGSLSRRLILEAALRLIDADGVEGLSMRRLASELGVFPTALYYYLPNKDALIRGVVGLVLARIELPDHGLGWGERLRKLALAFRRVVRPHPRLLPQLVAYPETTLEEYGVYEALYDALEEAGLGPVEIVRASTLLFSYVTGFTLAEANGTLGPLTRAERDDLDALPPEEFRATRRLAPQISAFDLDADFEFGIDAIIFSLAAKAERG
ncbi:MAG: TetR/AcrR family transcriptional regulator C-terminal domain-containing protein [Rubrobacter sp.]